MMEIRVLVVDDHPIVREGLRAVIELQADCSVVGEAGDGHAAVNAYKQLRPDVVIMDIRLPVVGGIEAMREIRRNDPDARIVAITSYGGDAELRAAVNAGAMGLLLKGASGAELVDAVRAVHTGRPYIADQATEELSKGCDAPSLTPREIEVLKLVAEGMRNHEIAAYLGIAQGTIKIHVNRILEKLNAVDRTEAVTRALRRGLIALQ